MLKSSKFFIIILALFTVLTVPGVLYAQTPGSNPNLAGILTSLKSQVASLQKLLDFYLVSSSNLAQLSVSLSNGLVGHWRFDEGSGTTTSDSSGNNNTGTLQNRSTWVDGKMGRGLNFDRLNGAVNAGSQSSLDNLSSFSVSGWIFPHTSGEGAKGRIIEKADADTPTNGWTLSTGGAAGSYRIEFEVDYDGTNLKRSSGNNSITPNAWQHIVFTWDGSSSASGAKIYINGVEASYGTTQNAIGSRVSDAVQSLKIGNSLATTRTFDGIIDELRIYNRVLTASEIQELFLDVGGTIPGPSPAPAPGPAPAPAPTPAPALTPLPIVLPASLQAPGSLNIPLTVHELLPLVVKKSSIVVPGRTRTQEPVTSGIPLRDEDGITNPSSLVVLGPGNVPVPSQFRVLKRYPSGNIQWVLVDFKADISANDSRTYVLTTGPNPASSLSSLAQDQGSSISINTGAGQFTVKKANFNGFDSVTVNGKELVSPARAKQGLIMRDQNDVVFSSANDSGSTALIEENGPLRTVVKADGSFKNGSGVRLMDYTVRLHFYRNSSAVKSFVTLRNAQNTGGSPGPVLFNSAEFVVPVEVINPRFEFSRVNNSSVSGTISEGSSAYLYQAFSKNFLSGEGHTHNCTTRRNIVAPMDRSCPTAGSSYDVYSQEGIEIKNGNTILQSLGNEQDGTKGWADLTGNGGAGLTVGMRWAAGYWPTGFEIRGSGEVSTEIFSKHNSKKALPFRWSVHETRELFFDFHANVVNGDDALWKVQYPLIARAPFTQYRDAGAFFGEKKLATYSEYEAWFNSRKNLVTGAGFSDRYVVPNRELDVERKYGWPSPNEQFDHALSQLLDFYRTGYSGLYLDAENRVFYNVDSAVRHSDGFDYSTNSLDPTGDSINGFEYDREHSHWFSLPMLYYFSGDERLREAVVDYGEFRDADASSYLNSTRILNASNRAWFRAWRDFTILYEFTGTEKYWNLLTKMATALLDSRDKTNDQGVFGRNMERGFIFLKTGIGGRDVSQNHISRIQPEAVWEVIRVMRLQGSRFSRLEDLEDAFEGQGIFAYEEPYFERVAVPPVQGNDFGYWAEVRGPGEFRDDNYKLDTPNILTEFTGLSSQDSCRLMPSMYELTGDEKYLVRGAKLFLGSVFGEVEQPGWYPCPYQIYVDLHRTDQPAGGWHRIEPLQVTDLGGGNYRLRWTVPTGAEKYQIKYSNKQIVEWLGFNQLTRQYQFSPDTYTAFFAATNISNEPNPTAAGSVQEFTLSAPAGSSFAIRYLKSGASGPSPSLTLTASPSSVSSGGSATLSWSSSNVSSCTATGDWLVTGAKSLNGNESTGSLTSSKTYTLACNGSFGSITRQVTVTVTTVTPTLSTSPFSLSLSL